MSGELFDKTMQGLTTSVNLRQVRQDIISANIANAETPGFHAKKVDFEEALSSALDTDGMRAQSTSHPDHFPVGGTGPGRVRPDVYENPDGAVNNDGNTVNLEKEMASLAENSILYKAALQLMNKKLAALRYAASEGR